VLDVLQIIEASRRNKNDSAMVAGLPCYVALSWCHNHDIATAEALSYHSPAADLKETFMAYFNFSFASCIDFVVCHVCAYCYSSIKYMKVLWSILLVSQSYVRNYHVCIVW